MKARERELAITLPTVDADVTFLKVEAIPGREEREGALKVWMVGLVKRGVPRRLCQTMRRRAGVGT